MIRRLMQNAAEGRLQEIDEAGGGGVLTTSSPALQESTRSSWRRTTIDLRRKDGGHVCVYVRGG